MNNEVLEGRIFSFIEPICWGKFNNDSNVCSGGGRCMEPNDCECFNGYWGDQCEHYECDGLHYTNNDVCNGFGSCESPNTCNCFSGFSTSESKCNNCDDVEICSGVDCYVTDIGKYECNCTIGKYFDGSSCVGCTLGLYCGNHYTTEPDCGAGFYCPDIYTKIPCPKGNRCPGPRNTAPIKCPKYKTSTVGSPVCDLFFCFNGYTGDSHVCSGHGTCANINLCRCNVNYGGKKCQDFKCDGISHLKSNVCNGFGTCKQGFSNSPVNYCGSCDSTNCGGGGGNCTVNSPNSYSCSCNELYLSGSECDKCTVNYYSEQIGTFQDGICYKKFSNEKKNWENSRDFCKKNFHPASDLAVIKDKRAQDAFMKEKGSSGMSWILLTDWEIQNTWNWMDGITPLYYENWNPRSPDISGDCAFIHKNGKWKNFYCQKKAPTCIVCALDMIDKSVDTSSNSQLNVRYKNNRFSSSYCDWENQNCPSGYDECFGVHESIACNTPNGTCFFNEITKENECNCNNEIMGDKCEYNNDQVASMNCDAKLDGICYVMFRNLKKTWENSRRYCKENFHITSDLAKIKSEKIQNVVESIVGNNIAWIGALDFEEGVWKWVDGSELSGSYNNFIGRADDGGKFGEDCVVMMESFNPYYNRWSTVNCRQMNNFICSMKINDEFEITSSNEWENVRYENLNTQSARCTCHETVGCDDTEKIVPIPGSPTIPGGSYNFIAFWASGGNMRFNMDSTKSIVPRQIQNIAYDDYPQPFPYGGFGDSTNNNEHVHLYIATGDPCVISPCGAECMAIDHCICDNTLQGCPGQIWCWNTWGWHPNVCSGHGTCNKINTCVCEANYYGNKCQHFKCNNIHHEDASVCNGFGKCTDHNVCKCNVGYSNSPTDFCGSCADSVCNGGGTCTVTAVSEYSCSCGSDSSGPSCNVCDIGGKTGVYMDGYCYAAYKGVRKNWQDARDFCKTNFHEASDIPVISDVRAHLGVMSVKGKKHSAWIMYTDWETANVWKWMDGSSHTYERWNVNSPDGEGNCAYVHRGGRWLNYYCSLKAVESVVCSLDMSDIVASSFSNALLNVGYKSNKFSYDYCNWMTDVCPVDYDICNGNPSASACNTVSGNGDCTFNVDTKENECVCQTGFEGTDCEYNDTSVVGKNCVPALGECYLFYNAPSLKMTWEDARQYCKSDWHIAADLAKIKTDEAQEVVKDLIGTRSAWIGAVDLVEGDFKWVDGSSLVFTRWQDFGDDGGRFGEDCVKMSG